MDSKGKTEIKRWKAKETLADLPEFKSWKSYCEKIGIPLRTADKWLERWFGNKRVIATLHTGDHESYTPEEYIESARLVMGSIDLDPASNDYANKTVKANVFYGTEDDGLSKDWQGNVFLNPPYEYPLVENFINKLIKEFKTGRVFQAILLTNNNTDTQWFYNAALNSSCICFTKGRINFNKPDGSMSQPTNGQAFYYFGENHNEFNAEFCQYGLLMTVVDGKNL